MPKVRLFKGTRDRIVRALNIYSSELREIIVAIQRQAEFAGRPIDDYVPKHLLDEANLASDSRYLVNSFGEKHNELFGVDFSDNQLRTIASALLLFKDDLNERLTSVGADSMMPPEANFPLEDELRSLDENLVELFGKYGQSDLLDELRGRRERKSGLAYPRSVDIAELIPDGEGQSMEFKEKFPDQAHEIAEEIAAFGTSNPGMILLGVSDSGNVVGIDGIDTSVGLDKLRTRIEGVSSNSINPSLPVRVRSLQINNINIAVIEVPKGPEPVYYTRSGVPYIRHGSISRPALPQEVNEIIRSHFERREANR